ncbi:MAG: TolC family protein [Sphingobacteriia bacterium]|nr:TolC family protein [Sphingobacteriia bacterium]
MKWLLLLIIAGCTVGPDYQRPPFFPDKQIEKTLNAKASKKNLPPLPIHDKTLQKLTTLALKNAPDLRIALLRLRQARENMKITDVASLPTIDLDAKYNYMKESRNLGYLLEEDYYQLGADVNWEIDIFGGGRRRTEAAIANAQSALENVKNTWISLVAEITNTYLDLKMTQAILANTHHLLDMQTKIYDTVFSKNKTGLVNESTLRQAEIDVATIRSKIPMLEAQKKLYENTLALLVGELPTKLNHLLETKEQKNIAFTDFSIDINPFYEIKAQVLRQRPDVRMAEENLIAQNASIGEAVAQLYPQVNLSALLGFQSYKFPKLTNRRSYGYTYVPEIILPVFHWGALMRQIKVAQLDKEIAMENYKQTLLQAVNEVKSALIDLEQENKVYLSVTESKDKKQRIAELARIQYKRGITPFADLLSAEQDFISAQNTWIQSNIQLYQNVVQYYKSIGAFSIRKDVPLKK